MTDARVWAARGLERQDPMSTGDRPRVLEPGIDLAMAPAPAWSPDADAADRIRPGRKRLKIWEVPSGWLCSIVGTCLMPGDVARIVRRSRLRFQDGTEDYEIHGFMVARASEPGRVGREINKVLDDKYAAIVRMVADEDDQERLAALWNELCGRGLVAGAYWAIMSHAQVADELKVHAFGEVHMLSHFMGGYNRHGAKEAWRAGQEAQRLADKLVRARRQNLETIAARDGRIGELEWELRCARHELAKAHEQRLPGSGRWPRGAARGWRGDRRLAAARARLRALDAENRRLKALLGVLTEVAAPRTVSVPEVVGPTGAAEHGAPPIESRCVLYVGGRCQLLPHLRARAEACNACLLHHDGGQEETLQALDGLVDRADVVFCPIDCVSHQACLKVKALCRRRDKPFVPLRSSSTTCFWRAMKALSGCPKESLRAVQPRDQQRAAGLRSEGAD